MNLFSDPQPSFVSVHAEQFTIDAKSYSQLCCLIQKAQPIRKLFQNNKLVCYSMDGKIGHKREIYCVFCDDNFHCQRKIRLSMILLDNANHRPVVLDINQKSFDAFEKLVNSIGEEQLKSSPVSLRVIYDENDQRVIEFIPH